MGLCYQTNMWQDQLWSEHLKMSSPARDLVDAGIKKQGEPFAGFPSDIHARLYLTSDPLQLDGPEWAARLHSLASELGEWQRLKSMCARNGFAAGVAAEAMLSQLLPLVPEQPRINSSTTSLSGNVQEAGDDHTAGDNNAPGTAVGIPAPSPETSDADLRAALRRATRQARDAVQEAESQLEGMSTPLGLSMTGSAATPSVGPANMKAIRDAHSRLKSSRRLQRITELAGRLERIAATKARSKINPGVGEVHGIDLGDDLSRLLPSELIALRHPRLRLALMSRLVQRRALTYGMKGREPIARGPVLICLDESSSMREQGKDIWSKAVCLALLCTATKQRRAWHLIAFNSGIRREVELPIGKASPALIQQALDHDCSGGTNFDKPIMKAIEVIRSSKTMHQADVVIITDGEAELESETIEAATALTKSEGVSWFTVGVGHEAELYLRYLRPIATSMVVVKDTGNAEPVIPVLNLERAA